MKYCMCIKICNIIYCCKQKMKMSRHIRNCTGCESYRYDRTVLLSDIFYLLSTLQPNAHTFPSTCLPRISMYTIYTSCHEFCYELINSDASYHACYLFGIAFRTSMHFDSELSTISHRSYR